MSQEEQEGVSLLSALKHYKNINHIKMMFITLSNKLATYFLLIMQL